MRLCLLGSLALLLAGSLAFAQSADPKDESTGPIKLYKSRRVPPADVLAKNLDTKWHVVGTTRETENLYTVWLSNRDPSVNPSTHVVPRVIKRIDTGYWVLIREKDARLIQH